MTYLVVRHAKHLPRKFGLYGKVLVSHGSRETIPETVDVIDVEWTVSRDDTRSTAR